MEAQAPTIDTRYVAVSTDTTARLVSEYKDIVEKVPLEIGRGGNSKEARRQQAGQAVQAQLQRDMDIIERQFTEHRQNIAKLAEGAKMVIAGAKDAVRVAEGQPTEHNLQVAARVTANAAGELNRIAKQATALDKAFGESWFKYRSLSLPEIPDNYKEDFTEARTRIMGDGKLVRARVDKLAQLVTQATAFTRMSQQLLNKGKKEKTDAVNQARELAQEMHTLLEKMESGKNIGWFAVGKKIETITTAAKLPTVQKQLLSNLKSVETDITSALKTYKTTVKTMGTVWTSSLRTLSAEDQKIKEVKVYLKAAKDDYDKAQKILAEANPDITQAVKDMVKIKAKPVK